MFIGVANEYECAETSAITLVSMKTTFVRQFNSGRRILDVGQLRFVNSHVIL
jgi:hypothetical protein